MRFSINTVWRNMNKQMGRRRMGEIKEGNTEWRKITKEKILKFTYPKDKWIQTRIPFICY